MSTEPKVQLTLVLYPDELTVYRLPKDTKVPETLFGLKWYTISKTMDELSITIPSSAQVFNEEKDLKIEPHWRLFKIDSVLDFGLVGILSSIIMPLKEAKIPVFVISTFDTDYILVKDENVAKATKAIIDATAYNVTESKLSLQ